jgi:hypothetical protein
LTPPALSSAACATLRGVGATSIITSSGNSTAATGAAVDGGSFFLAACPRPGAANAADAMVALAAAVRPRACSAAGGGRSARALLVGCCVVTRGWLDALGRRGPERRK